jgi:hypothetical protein
MSDLTVPEGYMPYRLFNYMEGDCICVLRPEQFIGLSVESPWTVKVSLKDGYLMYHFGDGPLAQKRAMAFIDELHVFIEEDALRNAHNAVMRKGRQNV